MPKKQLVLYSSNLDGTTKTLSVEGNQIKFKRTGTVYNVYHITNKAGSLEEKIVLHHGSQKRANLYAVQADICGVKVRIERIDPT